MHIMDSKLLNFKSADNSFVFCAIISASMGLE